VIRRYLGGPLAGDKLASKQASPVGPGDLAVSLHSGEIIGFCTLGRYHTGDVELSFAYLTEYGGRGLALCRELHLAGDRRALQQRRPALPRRTRLIVLTARGLAVWPGVPF
jgi:hypothetical protein